LEGKGARLPQVLHEQSSIKKKSSIVSPQLYQENKDNVVMTRAGDSLGIDGI
jgi:hypothetical protein